MRPLISIVTTESEVNMAKFKVGDCVQICNPLRPDFGDLGQVTSDYRSGQEQQAYGIHFGDSDKEYWVKEFDLRAVDIDALLLVKQKLNKG